jgi:hypothetical protein
MGPMRLLTPVLVRLVLMLVVIATTAARASAQDRDVDANAGAERKWPPFGIAIGAGIREIIPAGDSTSGYVTPTPVIRFIPRSYRRGLVPAFRLGIGKQRTTLIESSSPSGGASGSGAGQTEVGSIFIRPLTAGLGWSQPVANRMSIVFSATAGYSWNGFDATDNGRGHPQLFIPAAVASIGNSFVWDVSSRAWVDLNPRVSLVGGISFLSTHPQLTLADGSTRGWNANQVRIEAGIAFTVLKPLRSRRHPRS